MIRSRRRMRLCAVLLCLNLAFIWGNSLLPGSVSGAFSGWVKELLSGLFPFLPDSPETGHNLLRKIAHFTEFCCLGLLLSWLFGMLKKHWPWPLAWGAAAACLDETIQIFVPDRGPGLRDVGIDTAGVAFGMLLMLAGRWFWRRKKEKKGAFPGKL